MAASALDYAVFDRPSDELVAQWQLFVEGDTAHIVAMPHVTRAQIDRFADELQREAPVGAVASARPVEVGAA